MFSSTLHKDTFGSILSLYMVKVQVTGAVAVGEAV